MKQPVWSAVGAAVLLTFLAAFFGNSFVRRMAMVASRREALEQQLEEWTRSTDGRDLQARWNELHEYATKQAAADAQRQLGAISAGATASLIEQLKGKLDRENGVIGRLQDRFEDEFGRRIERDQEAPHEYEVGPPPTLTSDPLRYPHRVRLWGEAALAVAAYNELLIKSQPDLDRYERELKAQQQVVERATEQWEQLSRKRKELESLIGAIRKKPQKHLPSDEDISRRLKNSATVAALFGCSDAFAFVSALVLAVAVWTRTALIAGWIPESRILPE